MDNELLNYYQNYLKADKRAGKATVKNYLADIRRFINWYESRFNQRFDPKAVTKHTADVYLSGSMPSDVSPATLPSASSLKRYASSLRKFYSFLIEKNLAQQNPFELTLFTAIQPSDPWHLKEFRNYLFLSTVSKVTLKNYMIDVKQFTTWVDEVHNGIEMTERASVFKNVTTSMVEEYKKRLLHEAHFSPVSINRKLSSLRKYFTWANEQRLLNDTIAVASEVPSMDVFVAQTQLIEPVQPVAAISLEDFKSELPTEPETRVKTYSRFPPLRLLQKTSGAIGLGLGLLILRPIDKTAEAVRYSYWKASGRKVFAPAEEIIKTAAPIVTSTAIDQLQASSPITQSIQAAKIISLISSKVNLRTRIIPQVTGFSKSFYAPLAIKTAHLPMHKKVWHHVRHTRPAWYHRYHSYQIVHYLHYGILLLATSMIGFHVYTTMALQSRAQTAVTAIPATAPPRTLAFQGKLNDATNSPITAATDLRFTIYNSAVGTGSAQLWQESQAVTPDHDGVFRVTLGKKTVLPQDIFTNYPSLFLGISVGGGIELKPRQLLANVTNAANATALQGMKPITDTNAGTKNVVLALDSSGNLSVGGTANPVFQATGGEFTLSGQVLTLTTNPGSNSNVQIKPDGSGIIDLQKPIQNTSEYGSTPATLGAVAIEDIVAIIATSSSQSALNINQNGVGPIISANAGETAKFTVDSEGNSFFGGTVSLNGNKLSSSANTFDLINTNAININFGGTASSIAIGASFGTTTINNSLRVRGTTSLEGTVNFTGPITANGGLTVPSGQALTLPAFESGFIPYMNGHRQLDADASFVWDEGNKRLGIGTRFPGSKLTVAGLESGTGTALVIDSSGNIFKNSSSKRYKDDINHLQTNSLTLLNASPVSFRYNGTDMYDIGFIAEDFDALGLKDLVIYDKEGKPDAIKYDKLSIYILEIVKQQQEALKTLEETLVTIKAGYVELQQITSKNISNISENITIGGQTIKEYIDVAISGSETKTDKNSTPATLDSQVVSPVATDSASKGLDMTSSQEASTGATVQSQIASASAFLLSNGDSLYINGASTSAIASTSALRENNVTSDSSASNSGNVEPRSPLFQPGNILNIKYQAEKTDYTNIASYAADLAFVPNFKSDYATFNQGLIALGPTSLTDVGVSGKLSVGGNLHIDDNSINTIASDLNLQPLRQGNLSIMGGMVVIDTEGNLNVNGNANFAKDVTVKGKLAAGIIAPVPQEDLLISLPNKDDRSGSSLIVKNATGGAVLAINQSGDLLASGEGKFNALASKTFKVIRGVQADTSLTETVADGSAGTGVITAYERERTIRTQYVSEQSLIYVTATSNTQQVTPYVARQSDNSFTVQIPETVTKDITFNWWIVN